MTILDFINRYCLQSPAFRCKAVDLLRAYRAASAAPQPARSVLIADLARAGFPAGSDARNQTWIIGLALHAPVIWAVDPAGRVRRGKPVAA